MSTEKKLKDCLHLYLGCEVIASGSRGYLTGVTNGGCDCEIQFILEDGFNVSEEPEYNEVKEVKPILRHLSDMTEEEFDYLADKFLDDIIWSPATIYDFVSMFSKKLNIYKIAEVTQYLLSKHFDLFGLIDAGLAVRKQTQKTTIT